jgi:hypothetical protein
VYLGGEEEVRPVGCGNTMITPAVLKEIESTAEGREFLARMCRRADHTPPLLVPLDDIAVRRRRPQPQYGDMDFMIKQTEYDDSLFLFADTFEAHGTCMPLNHRPGHGPALNPYNRHGMYSARPRAAGIPTSSLAFGNFKSLDMPGVKTSIDGSIEEVRALLKKHNYPRIFYLKRDLMDGLEVEVRDYIMKQIATLGVENTSPCA